MIDSQALQAIQLETSELEKLKVAYVIGVLKSQGDSLDRVYLSQSAQSLGVSDLLQRAFNELE